VENKVADKKEPITFEDYRSILIVEDEEINYLYAKEILKGLNCEVFHARNGKEAVAFCKEEQKPSLILMDIRMPEINGYDTLKLIRGLEIDIPIIAQTAFTSDEEIDKIKLAGFDGYVFKPYRKEELYSVIRKNIKT
jgi:CheY-like chemotaxis protein